MPNLDESRNRSRLRQGLIIAAVTGTLVVLVGGTTVYRSQERDLRAQAEAQLASISHLKVEQIAHWREDRREDGEQASKDSHLIDLARRWLDAPSAELEGRLRDSLHTYRHGDRYRRVSLVSLSGDILLTEGDPVDALHPTVLTGLNKAFGEGVPVLTELHYNEGDESSYMDVVAPLRGPRGDRRPLAAIVFSVEARDLLFPLAQLWPTPSRTAETVLAVRVEDRALFLNDLRHISNPDMSMSVPMSDSRIPEVQALRGTRGVFEGTDYRGKKVLSFLTEIPDSPWIMVAKIDTEEAFAAWRTRSRFIVGLIFSLAVLVVSGLLLTWQSVRATRFRSAIEMERIRHSADERLAVTLASVGDAVISTDVHCRVEFMNPVAESLTGWTLAEARGRPLGDVFIITDECTGEPVESPAECVMRDGVVVGLAKCMVFHSRDGTVRAITGMSAPIRDVDGTITGVVLVFNDQTEEREAARALAESEMLFRTLIEQTDQGVTVGRPDGRILVYNDAMLAISGYSREEVEDGGWLNRVFPTPERQAYKALEGDLPHTEVSIVRKDGERRWLWVVTSPVRFEDEVHSLSIFTDVTEHKQAERELAEYRAHLEEMVIERTRDLHETNAELARATRAKSYFLASMSHELRTPLNSIIGFSGLLTEGMSGPLSDEQHAQVRVINTSGKHLLTLINDILNISKVEEGRVELAVSDFDPVRVVSEVVSTLAPLATESGIVLSFIAPIEAVRMHSDPGKVRQILLNLVGNAVKFTEQGSVDLRIELEGEWIAFTVSDTGPGISEEDAERVFERFVQLKTPTGEVKPSGTGLGLAISRDYARLLGGTIVLEGSSEEGAVFVLRIPRSL